MAGESGNPKKIRDENVTTRRAFLKKAGLAVGAATALYVAPTVTSVRAAPAYTVATSVPNFRCSNPANGATVGTSFDFEWTPHPDAKSYRIVSWRNSTNCGQGFGPHFTGAVTSPHGAGFANPLFVAWQVEAYDGVNLTGNLIATTECCWVNVGGASG